MIEILIVELRKKTTSHYIAMTYEKVVKDQVLRLCNLSIILHLSKLQFSRLVETILESWSRMAKLIPKHSLHLLLIEADTFSVTIVICT